MTDNNTLVLNFHTDIKTLDMVYSKCDAHRRYFKITTDKDFVYECEMGVTRYMTPATADKILRKMGNTKGPLNDMITATRALRNMSGSLRRGRALDTGRLLELNQIDQALDDAIRKFQLAGQTSLMDTIRNTPNQAHKIMTIGEAVRGAEPHVNKLCELIRGLPDDVMSATDKDVRLAHVAEAAAHIPTYNLGFAMGFFH